MALYEFDYEKEPVVSIVKKILTDAINMKASDIHFDPTTASLIIKFRINGTLQEYTIAPESVKTNITTRVKILSNMNITDTMRPQTGTINFEVEGKHHNMRVSSLPICDGEKIVIHIANYESNIKSLSKMGINPEDTEKIKRLIKNEQGLVLITGTASSGKTTTMYAMLKEISSKAINIMSIEDPVKMKLDGINQIEISPDKGITYKTALKHVMLQDPNVICIDNLINDEIARDAIRASITGRLIISSLYTKNAYTTIDDLLNMDIENYLLGANLNGIISQRLVKQLCPKCKEKRPATEYEKTIIKMILNQDIEELYYPKGCEECHNGYTNQIPITEVVELDDQIKNAITNKKDRKTIRDLLYKNNNTIIANGFNKVLEGETSFNEILRITDVKIDFIEEQNDIKNYILGNGTPTTSTEQNDIETQPIIEGTIVDELTPIEEEIPIEVATEPIPIEEEIPVSEEPTQIIEETPVEIESPTGEEPTPIEEIPTEVESPVYEEPTPTGEEIPNEVASPVYEEPTSIKEEITTEVTEEGINNNDIQVVENENIDEINIPEATIENPEETLEQNEVTVPTPIEANIVEEQPTPIAEDDDDEDDFSYGEGYENTF